MEATFTEKQNDQHRKAFIEETRQKAWGAACHADFISKQLDGAMAEYQKLEAEDRALDEEFKASEAAPDFHTVENRTKRDAMRKRRDTIKRIMQAVGQNVQQANRAIEELHRSIESNLALAKHAEDWGWKEVESEQK